MIGLAERTPFGGLTVPDGVRVVEIGAAVGPLTALHAPPSGRSRGTVLIVPGFTGSKEDHLRLLPLLAARGWDAYSYSQRGQADSAAPVGVDRYTLEALAADAIEVAGIVGGGAPVHLVGHSLGGVVARAAAIEAPAAIASLVLLCSGPRGWAGRHSDTEHLAANGGTDAIWNRDNPHTVGLADDELEPFAAFLRMRMHLTSDDNIVAGARILQSESDTTQELAATGIRTLVAHGVWDDKWPIEWQREMAERLGARYAVIPDSYHSPNLENPQATAELLDDFWG